VLFSGDEVEKRLEALSGGEAARLIFARQVVEQPNVLVLDEPTNHLDLEAIESLVEGLRRYEGSLIFVSHDRWFVGELATRVIELTPEGLNDFPGSYDEYLERCGDDHLDAQVALRKARVAKREGKPGRRRERTSRGGQRERKQVEARLEEVTEALQAAESRLAEINQRFCDPAFFERAPGAERAALEAEHREVSARSQALMQEWESLEERREALASG
jgi:energy-coupling factor transporter ATP-binding protein EcfA2